MFGELFQRVDPSAVGRLARGIDVQQVDRPVRSPGGCDLFRRIADDFDILYAESVEVPTGDPGPQRIQLDRHDLFEMPAQRSGIDSQSAGQIHGQPSFLCRNSFQQTLRPCRCRRFAAGLLVSDLRHDATRRIVARQLGPTPLEHPDLLRDGRVAQFQRNPVRIRLQVAFYEGLSVG